MRVITSFVLIGSLVASILVGGPSAASPPDGRTDALVAEVPDAEATAAPEWKPPRHFYLSRSVWTAIKNAARLAAQRASETCDLSSSDLATIMISPIPHEVDGGTTKVPPSPMTLSRFDEWSGTSRGGGAPNEVYANANYGLYVDREPELGRPRGVRTPPPGPPTPLARAFWHPGLGLWQMDLFIYRDPQLRANLPVGLAGSAIDNIDVSRAAPSVARYMANQYCRALEPVAGETDQAARARRRLRAWAPWDEASAEKVYQAITTSRGTYFTVSETDVGTSGGAQRRQCRLPGVARLVECWYVNPADAVRGGWWWATYPPIDGGSPRVRPTPLSHPFYVVKLDGAEHRYWLHVDTRYGTDIAAIRLLGKNPRPIDGEAGTGLKWSRRGLCDVTKRRGTC